MQWKGRRQSRNIEDRRGQSGGGGFRGGLGGGLGGGRITTGKGGAVGGLGAVVIVVVALLLGVDPSQLLGPTDGGQSGAPAELTQQDEQMGEFVSVTLADTEEIWARLFQEQLNRTYDPAVLVLFKGSTSSPCGGASQATGPFYCPGDQKVYLDTDFFLTMQQQLGAGGDFAAAYVVAHEIGHHVQDELGILTEANRVRQQVSQTESNQISVMIELQADCLSGIWAREAQAQFGSLEPGDIEEAINAAKQIGDDTLQRAAGQRVTPEGFTHGTSAQRMRWFQIGLDSGQIADCDTFQASAL